MLFFPFLEPTYAVNIPGADMMRSCCISLFAYYWPIIGHYMLISVVDFLSELPSRKTPPRTAYVILHKEVTILCYPLVEILSYGMITSV